MSQLVTSLPYHRVNILTGTRTARLVEDPVEYAKQIAKAQRPLLVLGPRLLKITLGGRLLLEYALDIAKTKNIPTCATATVKSKMVELGVKPDSVYDVVEIINNTLQKILPLLILSNIGKRKIGMGVIVFTHGHSLQMGSKMLEHRKPLFTKIGSKTEEYH